MLAADGSQGQVFSSAPVPTHHQAEADQASNYH